MPTPFVGRAGTAAEHLDIFVFFLTFAIAVVQPPILEFLIARGTLALDGKRL